MVWTYLSYKIGKEGDTGYGNECKRRMRRGKSRIKWENTIEGIAQQRGKTMARLKRI